MLKLPFTSIPSERFTCNLGGTKVTFETRYNDVGGFWAFDLTLTVGDVSLLTGVPILLGADLLGPYALGLGTMVAIDTANTDVDAGPEDLGDRIEVWWLTADEVAGAAASAA